MAWLKQHSLYMYRTSVQEKASKTKFKQFWNGCIIINCPKITLYCWMGLQTSEKVICWFVQPLYTIVQVNKVQKVWHSYQYGIFVQIFELLKDGMKACEFCEQDAGLFKSCKCLNFIDGENPSELMCGNCVYAGDCLCVVEADEWSPWTMPVQIIYGTAQWKKYSQRRQRRWRRSKRLKHSSTNL